MIIVKLMGGLGNQMFQYAAAKSLARHLNTNFKIDLEFLLDRTPKENFVYRNYDLDIFKITPEVATKKEVDSFSLDHSKKLEYYFKIIREKFIPHRYYTEPHFAYSNEFFLLPANTYLDGYWQTPKYFSSIEPEIRKDFTFVKDIIPESLELANEIRSCNSVCLNVRRTDFLNNNFHGVCDMKYFDPAVDIIASKVEDPRFYIFSDDTKWCYDNFKLPYPFKIVDDIHAGWKYSNYLQLMSFCKHFIIPNSSYAWWAVWLNNNADKIVIAPETWFTDKEWDAKDLIPEHWIRVKN